jgi:hypothetical protein
MKNQSFCNKRQNAYQKNDKGRSLILFFHKLDQIDDAFRDVKIDYFSEPVPVIMVFCNVFNNN